MSISIMNSRLAVALAVAFVAVSSSAAFSRDVFVRTNMTPVAAPVTNWSGFYVGGDVGGAFQHSNGTSNFFQNSLFPEIVNNFQNQSPGGSAVIGGVHAGYNWQVAPNWVVGIEGDWQWTNSRYAFCRQTDIQSAACSDNNRGVVDISGDTRSIGTVRGRLGWTVDRAMFYSTGGIAFADVKTSLGASCLVSGCGGSSTQTAAAVNSSTFKTGWVAGAGIEWMVGPNWLLRAEYLHVDLGNLSNTLTVDCNGDPCSVSWSRDLRYDVVRAGISYKFNSLY